MSTILDYSFTTTPNPLTLGIADGTFALIAANNTGSSVEIEGVSITIKTGIHEEDLTNNPDQINPVAPSGWKMSDPNISKGSYTFVFTPKSGETTIVPAYGSLVFRLTDIIVTSKGIAKISVMEGTTDDPTIDFSVSKFPSGWGKISFSALPPNLVNSGDVNLNWNGPVKTTYRIQYIDMHTQKIITIPAEGDPPLNHFGSYPGPNDPPLTIDITTNFTLEVEALILGQKYYTEISREVTVGEIPSVLKFDASISGKGIHSKLNLSWSCSENSIYAMPSWQPELLSPDASVQLNLPFDEEYSIKAVAVNGIKSQPLSITLDWGVVGEISFGDSNSSPWGIDLGPDQELAYVADQDANCIRKVDLTLFEQLETIDVPSNPRFVAVTPDGNYAFVGHYMGEGETTASVITLPESKVTNTFNLGSPYCGGLGVTPDGQFALVVNQGSVDESTLAFINVSSMKVVNTIKLGSQLGSANIAISPDGQKAYISEPNGASVTVVNIPDQKVIENIQVNMMPLPIQVTPDNKYAITAAFLSKDAIRINTETLKIVPPVIKIEDSFNSLGITADSSKAILGGMMGHAYFVDIEKFSLDRTVSIKGYPYGMAVTDNNLVIICNFNDGSLQVLGLDVINKK